MDKTVLKQKAEDYALKQWEGQLPWSIIQKAYYDGYRDCEKEMQAQIEKMKCCHNCRKFHNLSYDCTCAEVCNEWEIKEND